MAERLTFRILTPRREVLSREVDSANVMALEGEIGVLPGHAPLLAELRPGEAWFQDGGDVEYFALSDGFVEVGDDVVTALVRSAEPGREIDVERAEARRREREEELKKAQLEQFEMDRAEISLEKQVVRVQVAGRYGG